MVNPQRGPARPFGKLPRMPRMDCTSLVRKLIAPVNGGSLDLTLPDGHPTRASDWNITNEAPIQSANRPVHNSSYSLSCRL